MNIKFNFSLIFYVLINDRSRGDLIYLEDHISILSETCTLEKPTNASLSLLNKGDVKQVNMLKFNLHACKPHVQL
jgi:hypothetical protein